MREINKTQPLFEVQSTAWHGIQREDRGVL
jgi:hypothetical protein